MGIVDIMERITDIMVDITVGRIILLPVLLTLLLLLHLLLLNNLLNLYLCLNLIPREHLLVLPSQPRLNLLLNSKLTI
jgi:hypothetical protein